MSDSTVKWILRADGLFNLFAGLVLQLNLESVLRLIGWPVAQTRVYALVLGSALIGLSLIVLLIANRPAQEHDIILVSVLTHTLAGVTILYEIYFGGLQLPNPFLLPAAVGVQVLFVLGELAYVLTNRKSRKVAVQA